MLGRRAAAQPLADDERRATRRGSSTRYGQRRARSVARVAARRCRSMSASTALAEAARARRGRGSSGRRPASPHMLTKYEAIIATATVSASGAKSFLREAGEQQHRQEHRHRRQRRGEHRQRDGVGALERGLRGASCPMRWWRWIDSSTTTASSTSRPIASVSPPSVNAFSVWPGRVEDDQRDRERERDRDRDDERAAHALQEEQDDERDQDERLDDLLLAGRGRSCARRSTDRRTP